MDQIDETGDQEAQTAAVNDESVSQNKTIVIGRTAKRPAPCGIARAIE